MDIREKILRNNQEVWNRLHREGYRGYSGKERALKWLKLLLLNLPERINENMVLLDIGCGKGHWMEAFSPLVGEVHGVDISEEAVKLGRQRLSHLENVYFNVTEGDNLSMFNDETFDLVYSVHCFQHIPKKATLSYMIESWRVLKFSGYLVFQVITKPEKNPLDVELINREVTIGFNRELLVQMISKSGLALKAINLQRSPDWPWFWVVAHKEGGEIP